MKYYIYSYMWRNYGSQTFFGASDCDKCESIIDIYEEIELMEVDAVITSIQEITEEEFNKAERRGIIG